MNSKQGLTNLQLRILQAMAEEHHRLADEATRIWAAALARAEGTPLFDEQEEWGKAK